LEKEIEMSMTVNASQTSIDIADKIIDAAKDADKSINWFRLQSMIATQLDAAFEEGMKYKETEHFLRDLVRLKERKEKEDESNSR